MLIYQSAVISAYIRQPGYVRQVRTRRIVTYHALLFELLLLDVYCNITRTGLGLKYVAVQHQRLT